MEMHQVRYFLAVVRSLNFTRAADELRVAQPSLTRAIQKLELELEGPLFRRERSNTHLTELGRMMLPHLEATFAAAEAAKRQARLVRLQAIGSLTIAVSNEVDPSGPVSFLVAVAGKLVNLDVSIEVEAAASVERKLMAGQVDAAILSPIDDANDRFDLHLIHEDRIVVAFAGDHRFASLERVDLHALDDEPLVVQGHCPFDAEIARLMEAAGLRRLVRHRSTDPRWTAAFVRSGMASAILPEAVAVAGTLTYRRLDDVQLRFRTMLATVAGRRHSVALATLLRQIEARRRTGVTVP